MVTSLRWWQFIRGNGAAAKVGMIAVVAAMAALTMTTSGASATTSSRRWSPPIFIGAKGSSSSQVNYSISCPSSTFCAAVNGDGQFLFRRHGVWSSPRPLSMGGSIDSVSCSNQAFCVAVAAGEASVYNGHEWSSPIHMGPGSDTYDVSCPKSTFCAAVGASGIPGKKSALVTFNGHSWTTYRTSSTGKLKDRLLSVSCASPQLCMAANSDGQILGFNGSTWTPSLSSGPQNLISVSCTISKFCMAVTIDGQSVSYRNGKWSPHKSIIAFQGAGAYSISCASNSQCSVIGLSGAATSWTVGIWSSPAKVFSGGFSAGVAISCSSGGDCVAVNDRGMSSSR